HVGAQLQSGVRRDRRCGQRSHSHSGRRRRRPIWLVVDAEACGVKTASRLPWRVCIALLALLWLLPLYVMLANSLKTIREITQSQYVLPPGGLEVQNYAVALGVLRHGLVNSTLLALPATALAVLLGTGAGFFLARLRFRQSQAVFFAATIATFLPSMIVLILLS